MLSILDTLYIFCFFCFIIMFYFFRKKKNPEIKYGFPYSSVGKESACNAGDLGSIPGVGRSPGERNGNPLQYPFLENPIGRGAWRAAVHGVAKGWARQSDLTLNFTSNTTKC